MPVGSLPNLQNSVLCLQYLMMVCLEYLIMAYEDIEVHIAKKA